MADKNCLYFPCFLLKKFIATYKEFPCLWNKRCPTYYNKQKRYDAVTILTKLVQVVNPAATREHILKKIEGLRVSVRREHNRLKHSKKTATYPDEVYVPRLWYYESMTFIFVEDDPVNKIKIEEIEETETVEEDDCCFDQTMDNSYQEYKVANVKEVTTNIPVSHQYNYDASNRQCAEIPDEYDAIGINVAAKLRSLPPNTRILAEKLIHDVLYQALTNTLNTSTVLSTDPFKHDVIG